MNNTYPVPTDMTFTQAMFGQPMKYTGNLYIDFWLIGFFGIMFTGAMIYGQGGRKSSLFASFGTFIVAFLLTILSSYTSVPIAGGNQLIPATVLLLGSIVWNYMSSQGGY